MKATTRASENRPRLLLIEDEPAVAAFIYTALERKGYEVVPAASADEGLHTLAEHEFDGVISDFRTPGRVTGADVHRWLAKNRPELSRRLIFITGDIASDDTVFYLAQTGTPCIEKPFRLQQLVDAVEQTLAKQ